MARDIERAKRTQLAKGEVGLEDAELAAPVPVFKAYATHVIESLKARNQKAATVQFYEAKLKRILEFGKIADSTLDQITRQTINDYVLFSRRPKMRAAAGTGKKTTKVYQIAPATINRQLATLRMILHYAESEGITAAVPKIELLKGERQREFVLAASHEGLYLESFPSPLQDVALLLVDTGLRIGEALSLAWADVQLAPSAGFKFAFVNVRAGKSKNAERIVPLTPRVTDMLGRRRLSATHRLVFINEAGTGPWLVTSLNHQHQRVRKALNMPADFVLHSLRHTMLTRLGLAGADVFTIKKLAGHSSVKVSERYVHPSSESSERAIERMMSEYRHIGKAHASVESVMEDEGQTSRESKESLHFSLQEAVSNSGKSHKLLN